MSQRETSTSRAGASPAKLALIGVLAIVLIGVVASNFSSFAASEQPTVALNTEGQPTPSAATTTTAPAAAAGATGPLSPFGAFAEDKSWPALPLKEVTKFDPFATAAWAVPPELEAQEQSYNEEQIKELLHAENAIIFVAGDRRVALIGDKEFRVGDIIGGFKISDISSRGVVLSEVE